MELKNFQKRFLFLVSAILITCLITGHGCSKEESQKQGEATQEIHWIDDLDKALTMAQDQNKVLMIDFMAEWCPPCKKMEATTFNQPEVIKKSTLFIPLRIDVDKQADIANKYNCNASKYGGIGIPNLLFMTHEEKRVKHIIGYRDSESLIAVMDSVLTMVE